MKAGRTLDLCLWLFETHIVKGLSMQSYLKGYMQISVTIVVEFLGGAGGIQWIFTSL